MPWWNTSQGSRPSPERTWNAAPGAVGDQADVELHQPAARPGPVRASDRFVSPGQFWRRLALTQWPIARYWPRPYAGRLACQTEANVQTNCSRSAPGRSPSCCPASSSFPARSTWPWPTRSPCWSATAGWSPRPGCRPSASSPTELGLSRATVTAAYDQLRERGLLASRTGAGSFITIPPRRRDQPPQRRLNRWALPMPDPSEAIDLTCAAMPAPAGVLERALADAAPRLPALADGAGYDPMGLPRAARRDRRPLHPARRGHLARPDPDHQRRAARLRPAAARC